MGVAGFRVDLGVVHPDAPGRYLAGVECDGATYHRSATARDRDLLRERVLRGLGWRIHRVWSTDWWVDADRAIPTLERALHADLEDDRQKEAEQAATIEVASEVAAVIPAVDPGEAAPADMRPESGVLSGGKDAEVAAEPNQRYAEYVDVGAAAGAPSSDIGRRYVVADFAAVGFRLDRDAF
ncbi:MAG: hypothetical protein ACLPKT_23285 [Methylocella sp.]